MFAFLYDIIFLKLSGPVLQDIRHSYRYHLYTYFSPTCFFIRIKQTSYKGVSRKSEKKLVLYTDDVFPLHNLKLGDYVYHIYPFE